MPRRKHRTAPLTVGAKLATRDEVMRYVGAHTEQVLVPLLARLAEQIAALDARLPTPEDG